MRPIDHTHDPATRSWLDSANAATDFPVQNLPFGVFRRAGSAEAFRGGVAIGDQIVDLENLAAHAGDIDNPFQGLAHDALQAAAQPSLNALMALPPAAWRALRHALFNALRADATPAHRQALASALRPQAEAEHALPAKVGNYTDFFTSIHHVRNAGRLSTGAARTRSTPTSARSPLPTMAGRPAWWSAARRCAGPGASCRACRPTVAAPCSPPLPSWTMSGSWRCG